MLANALVDRVHLTVVDSGDWKVPQPDKDVSRGRGVALMRALMDKVHFESRTGDGSSVVLEKRLRFLPDSPITQLRSTPVSLPESDPKAEPTA